MERIEANNPSSAQLKKHKTLNQKLAIITLLLTALLSCTKNNKDNLSEDEKELVEILQSLSENGEGSDTLDSLKANRILELTKSMYDEWHEIKSTRGNFSIDFPNFEIKEGKTSQIIDNEEHVIYHHSVNLQNEGHENLAYRIDYSFCPDINTNDEIKEQFNSQRDYVLSATNATLEYEKKIDTLDYPGRELYLTIDESQVKAHYRMFFNDGVFYKLMVITKEGNLFNESIGKFLNSFKILEKSNE